MVRVSLTLIVSVDVVPTSLIPLIDKFEMAESFVDFDCLSNRCSTGITYTIGRHLKKVRVLLTLIAFAIDVAPASLIPLLDKSKKVSV